ncbi:hypothetical protein RHGRI_004880 [Rhododendron griersonianum]|uniref:DNA topoisomerase (ATP-hydrolyzing) n=1 Tax=Rhododendron griersonianum TaxID=479676 RepID=A0AAV6LC48_9ERIC|nr:hypothetical protein RHGRI_004880 [Rhododendron griersonianum]
MKSTDISTSNPVGLQVWARTILKKLHFLEYFNDLESHNKDIIWEDEQDGEAIELAFSKKKFEARKNWLRHFEPGTYLDQKEKLINSDFVYKELTVFNGRSSAVNTFDYKWYVCIQSTSFFTTFLIPKDDDILLDYLNEDGQSIEPTWYMPIIPMLVVNGSEGIGIGWSSNIPNYSLRDIVANVRHL